MVNPNTHLVGLIVKHLNGTLSEAEASELNAWITVSEENQRFFEQFGSNEYLCNELQKVTGYDVQLGWQKLTARAQLPRRMGVIKLRWLLSAAAAVFLLALLSWIFIISKPSSTTKENPVVVADKTDVGPGGDHAHLTLADGTVIILDSAGNGALAQQGGMKVVKMKDGSLKYEAVGGNQSGEVTYNTLTTPRGGKYQVQLPDGSIAFLNAESSIKYPTSFIGSKRQVSFTGEVFFEVAKNKAMPFEAKSNGVQIAVTGTSFNVQAYADEPVIRTTLLEGGVRIQSPGSGQIKTLKPGQQAQIKPDHSMVVTSDIDMEVVTAWKNNMFVFDGTNIEVLMRQLQRWYDVDVRYEDDVKALTFTGQISRYSNVSEVLEVLELSGACHFKLQNRAIVITK